MNFQENTFLRSFFINNNKLLLLSVVNNNNLKFYSYRFLLVRDSSLFTINSKSFFLKNFIKTVTAVGSKKIFYSELSLIGLGYRISVKNKVLRLSLGFSHTIFVLLPDFVFLLKRKTKILVYSFNLLNLSLFVSKLLRFKKLNVYKLKGLKKKNDVFKLKPGKRTK